MQAGAKSQDTGLFPPGSSAARRRARQQGLRAGSGGRVLAPIVFGYPDPAATPGRCLEEGRPREERTREEPRLSCRTTVVLSRVSDCGHSLPYSQRSLHPAWTGRARGPKGC